MKKRLFSLLLTLLLVTTMFVGCGKKEASESTGNANEVEKSKTETTDVSTKDEGNKEENTAEEPINLKVAVWDMSTTKAFEDLSKQFNEKYPNITVEYIDVASAEYTNKLTIMLNGSAEVDAFYIKDADTTLSMYKKGQLENLSPYIEKSGIDLSEYNGLAENFAFEGGQYGIPYRTDFYVLYYNKDVFDAAGEPYPSNDMTWDDYEAIAKKITTGEGATKTFGALTHTWNGTVQNWAMQSGEHTIISDDYSFMKPYYERALRMQNDDKSAMDYATLKTANIHYSSPFLNGQIGMMPMGSWFINTIILKKTEGETNINWGVAMLPHDKEVEVGTTIGATTPIAVNAFSSKKEAAWKFVEYVTSTDAADYLASIGTLPSRLNDSAVSKIASAEGMPDDVAGALAVKQIYLDRPIAEYVLEVNKVLGEEHSLIMLNGQSIDEGLLIMKERVQEIINK